MFPIYETIIFKKNTFTLKTITLLILLVLSFNIEAQFLDTLKSITHKKPSIDARLESRNSFITNYRAKISGVRLGVVFQKKLKVGIGYSWLAADIYDKKSIYNSLGKLDTVNNYLKLSYVAFYTDFVFHKTKRWQLSVPLQWGAGFSWHRYTDGNNTITSKKDYLLIYEPGISVQFKLLRWCGLGTDIAYRFAIEEHTGLSSKLNSPTYAFKFLVWFDQLYYMGFPRSKITKKYGPAEW